MRRSSKDVYNNIIEAEEGGEDLSPLSVGGAPAPGHQEPEQVAARPGGGWSRQAVTGE